LKIDDSKSRLDQLRRKRHRPRHHHPIDELTPGCPHPPTRLRSSIRETVSSSSPAPSRTGRCGKPGLKTLTTIMTVHYGIKRGYASDLTVGRLSTIRSPGLLQGPARSDVEGGRRLASQLKSGVFSRPGDSGSAIVEAREHILSRSRDRRVGNRRSIMTMAQNDIHVTLGGLLVCFIFIFILFS